MPPVTIADVTGAVRAYLTAYPGLTGAGGPLAGGVHVGHPRLPAEGAIAEVQVVTPRALADISDDARVQFRVRAGGRAAGALAETGARELARAMLALSGARQDVTTPRGETVRLLVAGDSNGPTLVGEPGGEVVWGFDCTVRLQEL